MEININNISEIFKFMAYIRGKAKGKFTVNPEIIEECIKQVYQWAKEKNISFEVVTPNRERLFVFIATGTITGGALGYFIANIPGAIAGSIIGGAIGGCAAHLTIQIDISVNPKVATITIL